MAMQTGPREDGTATAAERHEAERAALKRERAFYVAQGKKDRVRAVDEALKALGKPPAAEVEEPEQATVGTADAEQATA